MYLAVKPITTKDKRIMMAMIRFLIISIFSYIYKVEAKKDKNYCNYYCNEIQRPSPFQFFFIVINHILFYVMSYQLNQTPKPFLRKYSPNIFSISSASFLVGIGLYFSYKSGLNFSPYTLAYLFDL